jgi:ADP-ribose pyrophosphatase YjhB (NUDIX family)
VRAWTKSDPNGGVFAFPAGGMVIGRTEEEEDEEEEEEEEEADDNKPLEYVKGLPKRSRRKSSVANFTLQLENHGLQAKTELTARQKILLR